MYHGGYRLPILFGSFRIEVQVQRSSRRHICGILHKYILCYQILVQMPLKHVNTDYVPKLSYSDIKRVHLMLFTLKAKLRFHISTFVLGEPRFLPTKSWLNFILYKDSWIKFQYACYSSFWSDKIIVYKVTIILWTIQLLLVQIGYLHCVFQVLSH